MFKYRHSQGGFTLIEMLVVMSVFIVILMITASAFNTIITKTNIVARSEESNIEGVIGLEMLRHDLEQTGFGLFTEIDSEIGSITYPEATGTPASNYNDSNSVPRALVVGSEVVISGLTSTADYLVIKATTVGRSDTAQKWTYATDSGVPKIWNRNDFTADNDKMIVLKQEVRKSDKAIVRTLKQSTAANFAVSYSPTGAFRWAADGDTAPAKYAPSTSEMHYFYGLFNSSTMALTLTAPFNRSDYFVGRPAGISASCSPDTGVLYKSVLNHNATSTTVGGTQTAIPLLDCVADMQVVLGWNSDASPEKSTAVDTYSDASGSGLSGMITSPSIIQGYMADPTEVRRRLRLVKVYILAQDGGRDPNFRNPSGSSITIGGPGDPNPKTVQLNDGTSTSANKVNYRWKLHRIVVRPKNLY